MILSLDGFSGDKQVSDDEDFETLHGDGLRVRATDYLVVEN
jgi:hypothetical protein